MNSKKEKENMDNPQTDQDNQIGVSVKQKYDVRPIGQRVLHELGKPEKVGTFQCFEDGCGWRFNTTAYNYFDASDLREIARLIDEMNKACEIEAKIGTDTD